MYLMFPRGQYVNYAILLGVNPLKIDGDVILDKGFPEDVPLNGIKGLLI